MAVKIVDLHPVSPSRGVGAAQQTLPLLYFDITWLPSRPTETLHFYALECSESFFLTTIVDQLKHSLSLSLQHFLPLASKIIFPSAHNAAMPVARFSDGDSVALTIATSDADFDNMTGNHAREADEFHHLAPQLLPAVYSDDVIKFSAVAIQVTLFPGHGICIGFTVHHAICDATSLFSFIGAWAAINKSGGSGGDHLLRDFLPSYGRSSVQGSGKLGMLSWNRIKNSRPTVSLTLPLPLHKLRATFALSDLEIEKLKRFTTIKNPKISRRPSTFVVASAYLWSCLAKSAGEEVDDDEAEYLGSPVDCRRLLNPPLPHNYFGNCLMLLVAVSTHRRLKGKNGFLAGVEAISDDIVNGRGALDFHENRPRIFSGLAGKRMVSIAGSTRIDPYDADYGLGEAVKFEAIHTDLKELGVQLFKGRHGGVEIGMSLSKNKMNSFANMFNNFPYITSNL